MYTYSPSIVVEMTLYRQYNRLVVEIRLVVKMALSPQYIHRLFVEMRRGNDFVPTVRIFTL